MASHQLNGVVFFNVEDGSLMEWANARAPHTCNRMLSTLVTKLLVGDRIDIGPAWRIIKPLFVNNARTVVNPNDIKRAKSADSCTRAIDRSSRVGYRSILVLTSLANTRAVQSERRIPPAPIRAPECSSRLSGQRRILGTQPRANS